MKIVKLIKLPDMLTLLNAASGLFSIFASITQSFVTAAALMIIALVFDWSDGKIARMIKRKDGFGKQMDSLADIISFGVAPAVFGFFLIKTNIWTILALTFFLLCGTLRLARFNITDKMRGYHGMPITVNAIIFPLAYFLTPLKYMNWLAIIYVISGILMISSFKLKKRI